MGANVRSMKWSFNVDVVNENEVDLVIHADMKKDGMCILRMQEMVLYRPHLLFLITIK